MQATCMTAILDASRMRFAILLSLRYVIVRSWGKKCVSVIRRDQFEIVGEFSRKTNMDVVASD